MAESFPHMMYRATKNEQGVVSYESKIAKGQEDEDKWAAKGFVAGGAVEALRAIDPEAADKAIDTSGVKPDDWD